MEHPPSRPPWRLAVGVVLAVLALAGVTTWVDPGHPDQPEPGPSTFWVNPQGLTMYVSTATGEPDLVSSDGVRFYSYLSNVYLMHRSGTDLFDRLGTVRLRAIEGGRVLLNAKGQPDQVEILYWYALRNAHQSPPTT